MSIKDSIGSVIKLLVNVHDAELKAQLTEALIDAQGDALALQERVAHLQEENAQLRQQLQAHDEASKLADQLYYAMNVYWRKGEDILSAYCPACWDSKRLLARLSRDIRNSGRCGVCKNYYPYVYQSGRPNEGDLIR